MKKLLLLPCLLLILSCSPYKYKGMEIVGDGRDCFTKDNLKALCKLHFEPGERPSHFFSVNKRFVADSGCIGLYSCSFYGYRSKTIIYKVLKFEDKVYEFDEDTVKENEQNLNEFLTKYRQHYSDGDIEKLTAYFNKGTEYYGFF